MPTEHPLSRRSFLAAAAAAAAASSLAVSGLASCAHLGRRRDEGMLVYVGTYTDAGRAEGVYLFRLDAEAGTLRPAGAAAVGPNPSFLALHPTRRVLLAVNEVTEWEGQRTGAVSSFAEAPETGALTPAGRRVSHGGAPCYISVDRTGRFALVANYVGGSVAVLPIAGDALGEATAVVQHAGPAGPNAARQEAPHAHCIIPDPTNRFALAADLGLDRIFVYALDDAGRLAPAATPFAALPAGAGPRHLAFHPSGRFLYVVNELDLTLGAFRWDAAAGTLAPLAMVPLLAQRPAGEATAADLHVAPSGRFLYASVRGDDSIVVFAVDPASGAPAPVQRVSTEGLWPRNFGLDPSGRFLFVANQRSGSIVGFRVDADTGRLTPTGQRVEVPSPVCIRFAEGRPA